MATNIRIKFYESRWYLWLRQAHIVICGVFGHKWHELPRCDGSFKYTHFCPRCIKFITDLKAIKEALGE